MSHLSTGQKQALKAYILSVPALASQPLNDDGNLAIAAALNAPASPAYIVYRTSIEPAEYLAAITWTEYKAATVAERDTFALMTGVGTRALNYSLGTIRAAIAQAFSGAGGATTRAAIDLIGNRSATIFEKLLATGAGTLVAPSTMAIEGPLDPNEILPIRAS